MLAQFLQYLGGLGNGGGSAVNGDTINDGGDVNAGQNIPAGGQQPNFWQNMGGALNRSNQAGGGLGGLFAALNGGGASQGQSVPNSPTTAANSNQGSGLNWGAQPNGPQTGLSGKFGGL